MALTYTIAEVTRGVCGNKHYALFDIAISKTVAAGCTLPAKTLGLNVVEYAKANTAGATGFKFFYKTADGKLYVHYYDENAVADGPSIAVPNDTNVGTCKLFVIGH